MPLRVPLPFFYPNLHNKGGNRMPRKISLSAGGKDKIFYFVLLLPAILLCVAFIIIPIIDKMQDRKSVV